MTDNEIIKGLECCAGDDGCNVCPMYKPSSECITELQKQTLDLINRQKAELENQSENFKRLVAEHRKLQTDYSSMQSTLEKMSMGVEQARAEAIKEFAERLKSCAHEISCNVLLVVTKHDIDNLAKEMVGDTE